MRSVAKLIESCAFAFMRNTTFSNTASDMSPPPFETDKFRNRSSKLVMLTGGGLSLLCCSGDSFNFEKGPSSSFNSSSFISKHKSKNECSWLDLEFYILSAAFWKEKYNNIHDHERRKVLTNNSCALCGEKVRNNSNGNNKKNEEKKSTSRQ